MISVAVCDDEKAVREYIREAVLNSLAEMDLDGRVTEFDDGEPLCAAYENGTADFDLLLLDITMKRRDGLSAAKRIREYDRNVMIVFITASAEHVFSGYEVRAFRYLLKPELAHGFAGVFRECVAELTKSNEVRYTFRTVSEQISLPIRDILYFESDKRKVTVRCVSGKTFSFYAKLDAVQAELKNRDFVRCHQSYLVNAKKILSVRSAELELDGGAVLPVSKHRAKETNEAFLWAMR